MKKLILVLLFALIKTISYSQTVDFGIKGGYNLATQALSGYSPYGVPKSQSISGFNAGAILNIGFGNFSIQPGISFTTKGVQIPSHISSLPQFGNGVGNYVYPTDTYNFQYIEAVVNFLYGAPVSKNISIELGAGVYNGIGISASFNGKKMQGSFSDSTSTGNGYKNPDFGINFIGGIKVQKKFLINLQYSFGVANISENRLYPASNIKNRVLGLSVGYLFK